jgi:xylulokinase
MTVYLGVEIGTFESKGVLANANGSIVSAAARPPCDARSPAQPGRAEHRPMEDWWGDFVHFTRFLLASSGIDVKAVACGAIGPCVLPIDSDGQPLGNGVLYGVDARAADEIAELTARVLIRPKQWNRC